MSRIITPGPLDALRFNAWLGDRAPGNTLSRPINAYRASGSSTFAALWGRSSGNFQLITAGIQMAFVSGSASDAAAGVGARTLKVGMINQDWELVEESITLNGTNRVNTVATDIIALKYAKVVSTGSSQANVGEITMVDAATGTTVYGTMTALLCDSRNSMAWMPVERGNCAIITDLYIMNLTTPTSRALIRLNIFTIEGEDSTTFAVKKQSILFAANGQRMFPNGYFVNERSIVYAEHLVQTGGNEVHGGFTILSTSFT